MVGILADFFDEKHNIVLGGSWATHPRIAGRKSLYVLLPTLNLFTLLLLPVSISLIPIQLPSTYPTYFTYIPSINKPALPTLMFSKPFSQYMKIVGGIEKECTNEALVSF